MVNPTKSDDGAAHTRRQAETMAQANRAAQPEPLEDLSPVEIQRTLHELRVHQIELELQNEELRRTQLELESARARYFDIYDLAPVGYCTLSEEGMILEANLTASELLGVPRGALNGQFLTRFIFKEDQDLFYLHRKRLLATGTRQSLELRLFKNDGAILWVHLIVSRVEHEPDAVLLRVVLSDTTLLKQAEQDLRESNAKLEQLFEILPVGVSVLNRDGQIIRTNPALAQILGVSQAGLLGGESVQRSYFRPDGTSMPVEEFASSRVKQGEARALHVETGIEQEDGTRVWVDVSAAATPFPDWSMVLVIADITQRKQAEGEIHRLNAELEQRVIQRTAQLGISNKELEAFAYSVSHDLRAPLRAIAGFSRILQEDYASKLEAEGLRLLGVVLNNVSMMDQLILALLAVSRLNHSELRYAPIDMNRLVQSILDELATPALLERMVFNVSELPRAMGDPTLLRQVWVNLISNAIKYTQPMPAGVIEIHGSQAEGFCTYWIRDNGVGFDPQYGDKLFGLFRRLHSASEFEGNGVGLAIVERIIRRHGGWVRGAGQVNAGATFTFAIPEHPVEWADE